MGLFDANQLREHAAVVRRTATAWWQLDALIKGGALLKSVAASILLSSTSPS